ncbi:hypothetical protein BG011_002451 [Mortierella polycephala]|uniref:Uncharacterized protein n=1 Tax=Mortierella polycephala TaxID=41804 RepID=A0A9P6Q7H1_9FUNG|nr:hypothetical protein BG011_002451 [Mortierella polycephala]
MEQPKDTPRKLLIAAAIVFFIYIARDYPQWKSDRLAKEQKAQQQQHENTPSASPSNTYPDAPKATSPWPTSFSLRWVPYLPFAFIYLVIKAAWAGLRQLVFYMILAAEHLIIHIMTAIERAAHWIVTNGPNFVQDRILAPISSIALQVRHSVVIAQIKALIEDKAFPVLAAIAVSSFDAFKVASERSATWIQAKAQPVGSAIAWFAVECVYNPVLAVGSRFALLGRTFFQTAKIYLNELAKDVVDLFEFAVKMGTWIYDWALKPLGTRLYTLAQSVFQAAARSLLWTVHSLYIRVLLPSAQALVDCFRILRSHPTLMAGIMALSSKAKGQCRMVLDRLESVNWLILLETVLTRTTLFIYSNTVLLLRIIGLSIKTLMMEIIPNAYSDLMVALEVARPVFSWIMDKVFKVIHPLWQVVSWVARTVAVNAPPTLTWIHLKVVDPIIHLCQSTLFPRLSLMTSILIVHSRTVIDMVLKFVSTIVVIIAPLWSVLAKIAGAIQVLLAHMGMQVMNISGSFGRSIQEHIQSLGPQFITFQAQVGQAMDMVVLAANNFMMDWVKQEKRD